MRAKKGFFHDDVVRWKALERRFVEPLRWSDKYILHHGDLEECVLGQKIFEAGYVELKWAPPVDTKLENISQTVYVRSVSQELVDKYSIILKLVLRKDSGKYGVVDNMHTCDDTNYQRDISKIPRMPGPDQHVIAAIIGLQEKAPYMEKEYKLYPKDFIGLCDKLDTYYQGGFTSIFRRQIKYAVERVCAGIGDILDRFVGEPPTMVLQFEKHNAQLVALQNGKETTLEVRYGKRGQKAELHIPFALFQ